MRKKLFLACVLWFISLAAFAAQSPVVLLQNISTRMLTQLVQQKAAIKRNPAVLYNIVQRLLIPHVDLNTMSRSVVGNVYWKRASVAQRNEFKRQFTFFVTRTYSSALSSYSEEKILFYPIRGGIGNRKRVQVYSTIKRNDGPDIPMGYLLVKRGNGWKVYDFSIEGVSMVQSYRSQFANVLARKGFVGLINELRAHNRGGR